MSVAVIKNKSGSKISAWNGCRLIKMIFEVNQNISAEEIIFKTIHSMLWEINSTYFLKKCFSNSQKHLFDHKHGLYSASNWKLWLGKRVFLYLTKLNERNKNSKVLLFLNILLKWILHETIYHNNRDLPWITKSVKQLIKEKKRMNENLVKLCRSVSDNGVSDLETFSIPFLLTNSS